MQGGISTTQKCPLCGGKLVYDPKRGNCFCLDHPEISATKGYYVYFGARHQKRFKRIDVAERHLTRLRAEMDDDQFDPRDWFKSRPLGIRSLSEKWIMKKRTVKPALSPTRINDLENTLSRALDLWGDINIKLIHDDHITQFIAYDHRFKNDPDKLLSDTTIHNMCTILAEFLRWGSKVAGCKPIDVELPGFDFNETRPITIQQQLAILEWIKENCPEQKIWFAYQTLCRNAQVRPGAFCDVKWGHIDPFNGGIIYIYRHKSRKKKCRRAPAPKIAYLTDEQIAYLKTLKWGDPDEYFMTYTIQRSGVTPGKKIHPKVINKWVKKAGEALGVDTTCYASTKHTTATGLNQYLNREAIRRFGTQHETQEAYDHYQHDQITDQLRIQKAVDQMYKDARTKIGLVKSEGPVKDLLGGSGNS